jgi:ATP-dependent Lhr-like helicase
MGRVLASTARRKIRGRFVAGFSGKQYALPDAVGMLRKQGSGERVSLSGADPLNLVTF